MICVEVERLDAHAGDQYGRETTVNVSDGLLLSEMLASVLRPFLSRAPRATWVCRAKGAAGWQDVAQVETVGETGDRGARLLIADSSLRGFVGGSEDTLRIACRPSPA